MRWRKVVVATLGSRFMWPGSQYKTGLTVHITKTALVDFLIDSRSGKARKVYFFKMKGSRNLNKFIYGKIKPLKILVCNIFMTK